jgi:PAS domain S-box-containing protein
MLESELFTLLEQTADAAYSITEGGEICSWNAAAERLFGYPASEVVGRNIDAVLDARDALGTRALVTGSDSATRRLDGGIPNFDLEVRTRSDGRIWVNVSTIVFESRRTGRRLFGRLVRDINQHRLNEELLNRMLDAARQLVSLGHAPSHHAAVEALSEQELRILKLFAEGASSATIARKLRISAQTLRNHLHHINQKLRTHSRLEAVTHAQRRGLIV